MKRLLLIFIATAYSAVLMAVADVRFQHIGLQEGLSNGFALDITVDGQGFLWVATESGLNRISGNKCTVFRASQVGLGCDEHAQVLYDKDINSVWIVSIDGSVALYDCALQRFRSPSLPAALKDAGIFCVAKTSADDQEEGYDSGADSYLMKPFSAKLLQSRIRNILAGRRRLAEYVARQNMSAFGATDKVAGGEAGGQAASEKTDKREEASAIELSPLDQRFLDKLNKLIEENICVNDLDMTFVTDQMAMSQSTFYRKVKALTGMRPNEYIRKAKLQHAMQLLLSRQYGSVAEVATLAGFNNIGNFRESFKREFGKTPSEYLKNA